MIARVHVFCAVLAWSLIRFVRMPADEQQATTLAAPALRGTQRNDSADKRPHTTGLHNRARLASRERGRSREGGVGTPQPSTGWSDRPMTPGTQPVTSTMSITNSDRPATPGPLQHLAGGILTAPGCLQGHTAVMHNPGRHGSPVCALAAVLAISMMRKAPTHATASRTYRSSALWRSTAGEVGNRSPV